MKDIDYFHEKDLDKTNLKDFYNSLPSHLQTIFKEANHTLILWDNVLQGYRGPASHCNDGSGDSQVLESSYGIQQIKFWWGARKDINFLPVIGSLAFGITRIIQHVEDQLEWSSLYFDIANGNIVSYAEAEQIKRKNKEAENHNRKGNDLFEQGKYKEAFDEFECALKKCSICYSKQNAFSANRDKAKTEVDAINLNSEGDKLFNQGKYSEAHSKYKAAYNKSQISKEDVKYSANRDKAETEVEAVLLKELGDTEFNAGRYGNAKAKYQKAYDKSLVAVNKATYITCINKAEVELDAIHLKELGDAKFTAGQYDSAKVKYQSAYDKSSVAANKVVYTTCINKAKLELDAIDLKDLGDTKFNTGGYDSAKVKYQKAYDKSSVAANKAVYSDCINKAKLELDAIDLKELGDTKFNAGRYDSAEVKYQKAYDKSSVAANKAIYTTCINKAKLELNAIDLKELGDTEFNAGRYDSAKLKYQEAYDKSSVVANKAIYTAYINKAKVRQDNIEYAKNSADNAIIKNNAALAKQLKVMALRHASKESSNEKATAKKCKAESTTKSDLLPEQQQEKTDNEVINLETYNSVLYDFRRMLNADMTDNDLTEFKERLGIMMDTWYPSIVHRFHIVSLRIARKEMNSKLKLVTSINREELNDLRAAIISLIETEIEVLKQLNIIDRNLEQELKLLEEKLNVICDDESNNDVDIKSIAIRVNEIDDDIEVRVFETLAEETQLEYGGNALNLRDPLIAPIIETYLMNGMNQILQLRISSIQEKNLKRIKLLPANIIDTQINGINLRNVVRQLVYNSNGNEIIVIPCLIAAQNINMGTNINHWVGLMSERTLDGIVVSYLDSENSILNGLNAYILEAFKITHPTCKVCFRKISLEQQKFNNCGSELIENIVLCITGSRTDQESAIYLHSALWEQSLILANIKASQDKDMRATLSTLTKKLKDYDCNSMAFTMNN